MATSKNYSSDWTEVNGKLLRSALGRTGGIGELYDVRTEQFSSRLLFLSSFPEKFIKKQQSSRSEIEYSYNDQLSDRYKLLKIEADLQLSILLGQFSLSGNGKYLGEEKNSEKTVSCSLCYNVSTECEKLMASFGEIKEFIDMDVFVGDQYTQYTHVVVEINWGANCTFTFENYVSDLSKKTEAEGMIRGQMEKLAFLANFQASGHGDYKSSEKEAVNNINLKLYADVPFDGKIPHSAESAVEFMNKIPELLKLVNEGRGIPLKYAMIPLEAFRKIYACDIGIKVMLKTIDESFITSLVGFFENIAVVKQKLNDLKNDLTKFEKYLPQYCLSKIRKMEEEIKINETKLKTDLAQDLPKVRAGEIAMKDLIQKAEMHKSSALNIVKIEDFIEEFEPVKSKIDFINICLSKNVRYLGKNDDLDLIMITNLEKYFCIIYISKELREKNEKLFRKRLNSFLTEAESAEKNFEYIIVDFDINKKISCEVEDIKIVQYKGGRVMAHDGYKEHEAESAMNFAKLKNVIYLGKNDDLDSVMKKNLGNEFFIMYVSKELKEKNQELFRKSLNFFFNRAESAEQNSQYIIVDFDIHKKIPCEINEVKIVQYRGGKIVAHDVYKEHEAESAMNFAKLKNSTDIEYVKYKPTNRIVLKLMCPGSRKGTCSNEPVTWTCSICKDNLEYGFDNYFYCACGKAASHLYGFRCSSLHHGNDFLPVDKNFPLNEELEKLEPLEEMNILILGQSGVGKSTWINSIVNYLQYDTLEDAVKSGVICVIPANFTMIYVTEDKTFTQVVEVGDKDTNEVTTVGKSATQGPKTYNFLLSDRAVRLIDTPGLGDSEGIDKDKENMRMILDHISHLKKIHGICILMKSNNRRIDVFFKFCIMELLSNLHKSAARNILFCFTNSRSSFYSPGDTSAVLQKLISDLQLDDMITLNSRTMFCLDNEAFRFLCTLKYDNIPHTNNNREIYGESWEKSVEETKRLFNQIKELPPHEVTDPTTLCKARNRILNLTKPIAEITQTIQINLAAIKDQERRIENWSTSIEKLFKELYIPHIELQAESLNYPRTVCTSKSCVKFHRSQQTNVTHTEYVQICHDNCKLKGITTDTYPQTGLRYCSAMMPKNSTDSEVSYRWLPFPRSHCRECGCSWEHHMHITYTQKRVETKVIDRNIENEINDKRMAEEKIEAHKKQLEVTTKKYEEEQKIIMQTSLKFGVFLKENAITPYNDGFKDYLKYLIDTEKRKVDTTRIDDDVLVNVQNIMARYEKEVKIFE